MTDDAGDQTIEKLTPGSAGYQGTTGLWFENRRLRCCPSAALRNRQLLLTRYGVAASLDGFMAGPNGEVDWITLDPEVDFAEIWAQFDTLLMGRRTYIYEVAVQRLGEAVFVGITSVVFSRALEQEQHPKVKVAPELTCEWVTSLEAQTGKDVWLMGGSSLFRSFLDSGYVDRILRDGYSGRTGCGHSHASPSVQPYKSPIKQAVAGLRSAALAAAHCTKNSSK